MKYVRGSTITIKADQVKTSAGNVTLDSATLHLDFPTEDRGRDQATVTMTLSSGDWVGSWASSVAFPGTVFFSIHGVDGSVIYEQDGRFELVGNMANPDP